MIGGDKTGCRKPCFGGSCGCPGHWFQITGPQMAKNYLGNLPKIYILGPTSTSKRSRFVRFRFSSKPSRFVNHWSSKAGCSLTQRGYGYQRKQGPCKMGFGKYHLVPSYLCSWQPIHLTPFSSHTTPSNILFWSCPMGSFWNSTFVPFFPFLPLFRVPLMPNWTRLLPDPHLQFIKNHKAQLCHCSEPLLLG